MTEGAVDNVVTVRTACQLLGVTQQTIYKLIREERVKAFKLPGRTSPYRIYRESLDDYIGSLSTSSPFARVLRETFPEEDSIHIRVLELRFRDGLDDDGISEEMGVVAEKIYRWVVEALMTLAPVAKANLTYNDVKDNKFALRVMAQLYLAEEE